MQCSTTASNRLPGVQWHILMLTCFTPWHCCNDSTAAKQNPAPCTSCYLPVFTCKLCVLLWTAIATGISNSSGAWITPGFQLHLSKVDQVSPKLPVALAGMRFPAALAQHRSQPQQQQQQQQEESEGQGQQQEGGGEQQQQQLAAEEVDFLPDVDAV
jgi:hypothetical protein